MSDFILIDRFRPQDIEGLFELTDEIKDKPDLFATKCRGKILAPCFMSRAPGRGSPSKAPC